MELVVYSKPDCPLCDKALAAVQASGLANRLTIRTVNIEDNEELFRRFRFEIPVLYLGGRKMLSGIVTAADFRARFDEMESQP